MTYDGSVIHFYMDGVQETGKVRGFACKQLILASSTTC
jgi:hypothetical protein